MCETCKRLRAKVDRAAQEGDTKRENVMRVLLSNHQRDCTAAKQENQARRPALVTDEVVFWPNGTVWEVK